jgi:hypothetical protein
MKTLYVALCICIAFALGMFVPRTGPHAVSAATTNPPTQGWNLHIDAEQHFGPEHAKEIAHHWCKPVSGGLTECQIYNSDAPDAQLVAVETILPSATYKTLPPSEQAMWHWHKTEIAKVNATLPDTPPDEAKKIVAQMVDTYGKIYVLFDPLSNNGLPIGQPSVTVLK